MYNIKQSVYNLLQIILIDLCEMLGFLQMDASSNLSKDQLVKCCLDYHYWSRSMVAGGLPTAGDG